MNRILILLAGLLVVGNAYALPPCPTSGVFHNCFAAYTFDDGDKYVGEWKENQMHGLGTYTWANGDKYIGEFRDGRNTYGVQYSALDRLQGTFSNGEWCEECEPNANQLALVREIDPSLIAAVSKERRSDLAQFLSDANRTQDNYRKCNAWFYSGPFEYEGIVFQNWADVLDKQFNQWGRQSDVASELSQYCSPFLDSTRLVWIAPSELDNSGGVPQISTALPSCPTSGVFDNCFGSYTDADGNKYVGEWKDDKRHGQGTSFWADGDQHVGEYKNGKEHGHGTYRWADGDVYVGEFKDGEEHGHGTYTWADGDMYVGEHKGGTKHGHGTYLFGPNAGESAGGKYVGEYKDGRVWEGVQYSASGKVQGTYSHGEWCEQCEPTASQLALVREIDPSHIVGALPPCPTSGYFDNCFGSYTDADGNKYVGEWKDDKRHGQGTSTFADGDQYVGEFKDGEVHGHGTYLFGPNAGEFAGDKYVGEFKDGMKHGHGTYTWADGDVYVGEWKDGNPWEGVQYSASGKVQGTYSNGEPCGGCEPTARQLVLVREIDPSHIAAALPPCPSSGVFHNCFGTFTSDDGHKYVGEWKDDKMHGSGTYTFGPGDHEGDKFIGEWKDNKPWQGVEYSPSGEVKGTFSNGEWCEECEPTASQLALVREIDPAYIVGSADSCTSNPDSAACEEIGSRSESGLRLIGTGTGFVINPDYVVTADHVLEGCNQVAIVHAHQKTVVQTVARDRSNDLGLLRLDKAFLHTAKLRGGSSIRLGERVSNYGYPLFGDISTSATITEGNINNLSGVGNDSTVMQFDAPTQPGNSGGPLLDSSGNVVGVVIYILSKEYADATGHIAQNVNFAVKSTIVENFLQSHNVQFEEASPTEQLDLPDLAEKAETFTVLVECWQ